MLFTFTILLSLIFSFPQKKSSKLDSIKTKKLPLDIGKLPDSLHAKLFKIPQSTKKDFIYTPPPGIDYKIKIFKPDSTVDYKIKKYYYRDNIPDSIKRYLKEFVPRKK